MTPERRPNLIVVMIDSLRRDHVGAYGGALAATPALDRLAAMSMVFDRVFPEGLPTIPVRRALFSGRRSFPSYDWRPWKGEVVQLRGWQPLRETDITLAEILRANGYVCGLVADTHHLFKPGMNFTRGFHAYTHVRGQVSDPFKSQPLPDELVRRFVHPELDDWSAGRVRQHLRNNLGRRREEDYLPARVFRAAADWLAENRAHLNLFLWVDCFDPHEPWDPPREYVERYDRGYSGREFILAREGDCSYLSASELRHCRARYAAEVTFVDRWLGWFLDQVLALGLWENSVFLLLSDHGLLLGEHGVIAKVPWALYPELIEIPLLLHVPGRTRAGARAQVLIQHHDVLPTLLDVLGVPRLSDYPIEGQSFVGAIEPGGPMPDRELVVCGYHDCALVEDQDWSLIFAPDASRRRLFDLRSDPGRLVNLYDKRPDVVDRMQAHLRAVADLDRLGIRPD